MDEAGRRAVVRLLSSRLGLEALWLYGSVAAGRARPDSDLDLAGLFLRTPSPDDLLAARADATAALGREVDLVDLEQASPILAMQVMKHGRLLHETGPGRRVLFGAQLVSRYEDVKRLREPIERAAMERLRGRA